MTWNDITTKQYYGLVKASEEYEDDFDRRLAIIAALTNQTFDEVTDLTMSEIRKLSEKFEFTNTPCPSKVVTKWKDYRFTLKLSDLKAEQFIDYIQTTKGDINFQLHSILAILDNTGGLYTDKEADFLNCPFPIVKGISDFFFRKYEVSPRIIQSYSLSKMKQLNQKIVKMSHDLKEVHS